MNKSIKVLLVITVLLLVISTIGMFKGEQRYSQTGIYVGLTGLFIILSAQHLLKANSSSLFAIYLLLFTGFFICKNYEPLEGLRSMVYFGKEDAVLTLRNLFHFYNVCFAIFCLAINESFDDLRKRKVFYLSMILMVLYLILEMPIYDVHGDFGGRSHGHSFWYGFHFH